MTDTEKSSPMLPWWKHLWMRGFVLALGFVLIASLVWFFISGTPYSPVSNQDEKAPQAQTQLSQSAPADHQDAPAAPEESTALLKSQLQQVISEIREANQKKDLSKLLSYYSPNFPGLPQRTQSISKAWKIYDYPKIEFEIQDIKLLPGDTAVARVKWDVEAKNINTQKSKKISKTYLIRFGKESEQWRIKALDNAE